MSLRAHLMPHVASAVSSNFLRDQRRRLRELTRAVSGGLHELDAFLAIDDPYSYLLIQGLVEMSKRFNISVTVHTIQSYQEDMFPERKMWHENAIQDAQWLADLYELPFPSDLTAAKLSKVFEKADRYTLQLVQEEIKGASIREIAEMFASFWEGWSSAPIRMDNQVLTSRIEENENKLLKLGHYMSGMVYYGGEWYWGLDRLDHLEERLVELNACRERGPECRVRYNRTWVDFCGQKKASSPEKTMNKALEVFFSIRSPYSHLGLERAAELSCHYGVPLNIKPVLPMIMRGLPVPDTKKMYIFLDTKREANKLNIPYGKVADPLGKGVERCYAIYPYAESEGKGLEYLLSYARGVNAEGILSETDAGLKVLVERVGLNWKKAQSFISDQSWREWAQANLDELSAQGLWGVPCFKYGDTTVWGQDRLYRIEQKIRRNIHSH